MNFIGRPALWGVGAVAVLVAGAVVVLSLSEGGSRAGAPTPTRVPPAASASAAPVPLPHVATATGSVSDWVIAPATKVANVAPEVGDAADGAVALSIDAPVVDKPIVVASISVPVIPGGPYAVTAKVRLLTPRPTAVGAKLQAGPNSTSLPNLDANWTEVRLQLTPTTPHIVVGLELDSPVLGLDLDDVRVVGADGVNVAPNPSFEVVTDAARIANDSLVLSSGTAAIAVRLPKGEARWKVTRGDTSLALGSLSSTGGLQAIPLRGLGAGYLNFSVTDAVGSTTVTPIAVIDRARAAGVLDPRFGVGIHLEQKTNDAAARYARSLGIGNIRNDVSWKRNELKRGVYSFDSIYASGFEKLRLNGISSLGIVDYGNKLYGNEKVPDDPEAIAAYGRYAAAIAKQFDLAALEVYNEFNMNRFNNGRCGTDPKCYMPLLTAVREQVRAVDPRVAIVSGATANYDSVWLNGLWQNGGLEYSDAMSFHPYQVTKDPDALAGIVADARAGMQQFGKTTKPMWITELGAPSTPEFGTAEEQATYALKATVTALGSGAEKLYWYDLINDTPDPHALESNFGLFGSAIPGVAALPPKPAAFVEALLIDQLQGKPAASKPSLGEGIIAYSFGSGPESVTVAWAPNGASTVGYKTTAPIEIVATDGLVTKVKPKHGVAVVSVPKTGIFIRAASSTAH